MVANTSLDFGLHGKAQDNRFPISQETDGSSWEATPTYISKDWAFAGINKLHWDQYHPYQLLVIDYSTGSPQVDNKWEFTLPISPSDLRTTLPFAIRTTITQGGVVEQHNGVRAMPIVFSGTFGTMLDRPTSGYFEPFSNGRAIFAGVVTGFSRANAAADTQVTKKLQEAAMVSDTDISSKDAGKTTGYYQARMMSQFLESYAAMKQTEEGRNRVLALAIWKDEAVYLGTPVQYISHRSANDPFGYSYTFAFKAWKRVDLKEPKFHTSAKPSLTADKDTYHKILDKVIQARKVLQNLASGISSMRSDLQYAVLDSLRQVNLFTKDVLGVPLAIADLPANIIKDMYEPAMQTVAATKRNVSGIGQASDLLTSNIDNDAQYLINQLTAAGVIEGAVSTGRAQSSGAKPNLSLPARNIFNNPNRYYSVLSQIQPGRLNLPPHLKDFINRERAKTQKMTTKDFRALRDTIETAAETLAEAVGAVSSPATSKSPTDNDYSVLWALNDVSMALSKLALAPPPSVTTNPLDYVAGLASQSGIAFKVPVSKYAVPFPYGASLESLAAKYLGDPQRWHEIASLNGLEDPYVDETGFSYPLLSNPTKNTVVVASATNMYVGQQAWLGSSTVPAFTRRVLDIKVVDATQTLIEVDGDELTGLNTLNSAYIKAYLPNTINSGMVLYIPSDKPPIDGDTFVTTHIPTVDEYDPMLHVGGIDLMLTAEGDLAITDTGNCQLAYGMANLIQRVKIAVGTPKGSMLLHPDFGIGVRIGSNTADVNAHDILSQAKRMLSNDPAFSGVLGAAVNKNGPSLSIALEVGVARTDKILPIVVDLR